MIAAADMALVVHEDAEALLRRTGADARALGLMAAATEAQARAALSRAPGAIYVVRSPLFSAALYAELAAAPSARWLQVGGSGYEHLGGWDAARLTVSNGRGVLAEHLVETALGAMLALNHNLIAYHDHQRAKQWRPMRFPALAGQTLLVVGLGAIGASFAARASALGMRVIGLRREAGPAPAGVTEVRPLSALRTSLGEADVVSLHLRLTEATRGLFDAAAFAAMKPGALLLNSARGGLVDEPALLAALRDGRLRGAWADVFATEPLPPNHPLWDAPNLLITPHAADAVEDWEARLFRFFLDNLSRWRRGEALLNRVAPP